MILINKIKKFINKKYISIDKVNESIRKAVDREIAEVKKVHGAEVSELIDNMYEDKRIEIEEIKAEMKKLEEKNSRLQKRNDYLEELYIENAEIAKKNSIITQEMSTDAMRLENELVRLTGLIHGINNRAQDHYRNTEKKKQKAKNKLEKLVV